MINPQEDLSPDEKLLNEALLFNHEDACGIVFESLAAGREDMTRNEEIAFAHIYNCLEEKCGEFWQEMAALYPDENSRGKLYKHIHLTKIMEARRDKMFPTLNPFWAERD